MSFITTPDFEFATDSGGNNVYDVVVTASDGSLVDTQAIAVATVTNVNEAPFITSNGGGATASVSVAENTTVVTLTWTGRQGCRNHAHLFNRGRCHSAKFAIDPSTGVLSFVTAPDFEHPTDSGANNVYDVTVQVSDGSLTDTQAIAVTVTDVWRGSRQRTFN